MLDLPEILLNLDLECTTWEGAPQRNWSGPGEHREVVQLGAVIVNTENFEELSSFNCLVKPTVNPELSDLFKELTGISQKDVDESGLDFETAISEFNEFCRDHDLYCFDHVGLNRLFDRDVLEENCDILGLKFPFEKKRFHNVNLFFHEHGYKIKQSGRAPEAFGIDLPARPHNALNDARGIIIALEALKTKLAKE